MLLNFHASTQVGLWMKVKLKSSTKLGTTDTKKQVWNYSNCAFCGYTCHTILAPLWWHMRPPNHSALHHCVRPLTSHVWHPLPGDHAPVPTPDLILLILILFILLFLLLLLLLTVLPEMDKDALSARAVCVNFSQLCYFLVFARVFLKVFCLFV